MSRNAFAWCLPLVLVACGGVEGDESWDDSDLASFESEATAKVNVNLATVAELQKLPAITVPIAEQIVTKRPWFTLVGLKTVPGITTTVYSGISSRITIGPDCGGRTNLKCTVANTQCARKTTAVTSIGVCIPTPPVVPPAPTLVTLVPEATYSIFAHDPGQKYAHRVLYGYTTATQGDFARASDKGSLAWYRDPAARTAGNFEKVLEYMTPTPAGYYTQVNRAVSVAPLGKGILYRVIFRCRSNGDTDCEEGPITYRPAGAGTGVLWAGNWGQRSFYPGTGRGLAMPDLLQVGATGHYPPSITLEFWAPGLTEYAYADAGVRVELETDLWFDMAPNHPGPGGALQHYVMSLGEREGNNWRATMTMPVNYQRAEWNGTFKYRARITTDGGRTWVYAGKGDGLSTGESWRQIKVGTACADGTNTCQ